jgi:hypothetical protein
MFKGVGVRCVVTGDTHILGGGPPQPEHARGATDPALASRPLRSFASRTATAEGCGWGTPPRRRWPRRRCWAQTRLPSPHPHQRRRACGGGGVHSPSIPHNKQSKQGAPGRAGRCARTHERHQSRFFMHTQTHLQHTHVWALIGAHTHAHKQTQQFRGCSNAHPRAGDVRRREPDGEPPHKLHELLER